MFKLIKIVCYCYVVMPKHFTRNFINVFWCIARFHVVSFFPLHIEEKHMEDKDHRVNTARKSPGKIPLNSKKGVNEKSSTNELLSGWLTVKI